MDFTPYIRKPFTIEAVEVTRDNLDEIAELVSGRVEEYNGRKTIKVNNRVIPNIPTIYVGWFVTRTDGNYRAYSAKRFKEMFTPWQPAVGFVIDPVKPTDPNEK